MTKMHFTRAAEMVKSIREGNWTNAYPCWAVHDADDPSEQIEVSTNARGNVNPYLVRAVWTAEAFILLFREYNPRFNEAKFLKACGLV